MFRFYNFLFVLLILFPQVGFAKSDWPSGKLMTSTGSNYVGIGTIATAPEICKIFSHSFFKPSKVIDYNELDTISSDFRWKGIEASSLWIQKKFSEQSLKTNTGGLHFDKKTGLIADYNLSACLNAIKMKRPKFYTWIKKRFLYYLKDDCLEQKFKIKKDVDNNGNIIEKRIPLKKKSCINFNYNGRNYSNWNSTTFSLMLVWKEAHPVLNKIFDNGRKTLDARIVIRDKRLEQERIVEDMEKAKRKRQEEVRKQRKKAWLDYSSREKKIMEQVYNFSSSGDVNGKEYNYWVELKACVLTNGNQTIDNREINMTAFRIYPEIRNNQTVRITSSDGKFTFSTSENIPSDRLQRAWKLAFKECPGKTSKF